MPRCDRPAIGRPAFTCSIDLIDGQHGMPKGSVTLTGDVKTTMGVSPRFCPSCEPCALSLPADPHLLYSTDAGTTEHLIGGAGSLPSPARRSTRWPRARPVVIWWVSTLRVETFQWVRQFAFGQRNWFSAATFNLEWSLHLHADKATKSAYAGLQWDRDVAGRQARLVGP